MKNSMIAVFGALVMSACSSEPEFVCGDGLVEGPEACDDGNPNDDDGCDACAIQRGYTCADGTSCDPICNDGLVVAAEVCDPSYYDWRDYCSADCMTRIASCGDGTRQPREACDDGNTVVSDGCSATCDASFGWTCDASGACDASSVDPTVTLGALDSAQLTSICAWMVGFLGGPGHVHYCGSVNYTVNTIPACVTGLGGLTSGASAACTVAQFEAWTANASNPCGFFQATTPICS